MADPLKRCAKATNSKPLPFLEAESYFIEKHLI